MIPTEARFCDDDVVEHLHNTGLLPILTRTLREVGVRKRCGISSVEPRSQIGEHCDADPDPPGGRTLRAMFGLDVPVEPGRTCHLSVWNASEQRWETRRLENGTLMCFDPAIRHKVENDLGGTRHMVVMDIEWFPDKTGALRPQGSTTE